MDITPQEQEAYDGLVYGIVRDDPLMTALDIGEITAGMEPEQIEFFFRAVERFRATPEEAEERLAASFAAATDAYISSHPWTPEDLELVRTVQGGLAIMVLVLVFILGVLIGLLA